MSKIYRLEHIEKVFLSGDDKVEVLKDITLEIDAGESVAIVGASGSGKSTLLHIMGALDYPTKGRIFFKNKNIGLFSEKQKACFRNQKIGFVFQFHHLLPEFSMLENVAMPGIIRGLSKNRIFSLAKEALSMVGLEEFSRPVSVLSGGEKQRVAIARAIVLKPEVILADEPTGNLDEANGVKVGNLLCRLNKELGTTLVVVTHNHILASLMQKTYQLKLGELYAL
ncbi:ABC transporter ATP-binding protein [Desulfonauticus submarinus]